MLFSELIQLISEKLSVESVNICDAFDIKDTALLDGVQEEFQNNVLYIGYYEQIGSQQLPPHCVLVRTPETAALKCSTSDLALTGEVSLFFLVNVAKALVDASRSKGLYAELMDNAAKTRNITSFVNLAASKLGNSIILLDTDFKVLSFSTVYPIDDPLWEQNIRQGYCSYEFISAVNELDSIKNAPQTSEPIVVVCYASPLRKLSSKVFHNGQMIGFAIMLENESTLSSSHFEMLATVSAAAGDIIVKFAPYLLPDSTHYQRLLYDLLIGAPPEKLAPHIAKLSFPVNMYALRISQSHDLGLKHLKEHVAEKLKALLPGTHLTLHENGIAALVALEDAAGISQAQLSILQDFADIEQLGIGVSNTFYKIEDFSHHYSQACRALELNRHLLGENSVCRYMDYAFFDLLGAVKKTGGLVAFCHPALSLLHKYDTENNTELYHTLDVYLSCDCSIKLSSEKLFIHRNSLTYRLRRIFELTQIDPGNCNTRFLLEMSFLIDHYMDNAHKKMAND